MDSLKDGLTATDSLRLAKPGAGAVFPKSTLHFVEVADLPEDPGGPLLRFALHEGFVELPSRMRPAPGQSDALVFPGIGPIGTEGVTGSFQ